MTASITRFLAHVGFWFATLMMAAVMAWTLHRASMQEAGALEWVRHTQEVLREVDVIKGAMTTAESDQLSDLLTGNDGAIARRDGALTEVTEAIATMRALTADNPSQQLRLDTLDHLIAARVTQMRSGPGGTTVPEIARTRSATLDGQQSSAAIFELTNALRQDELKLLEQRSAEAELHHEAGLGILSAAILVCMGIMIPGYLGFIMQIRSRNQTEKKLRVMADSLPGAMYQLKLDAKRDSEFTFLSAGSKNVFGIRATTLPDWDLLVHAIDERDRPAFVVALDQARQSSSPFHYDYRVRDDEGNLKWLHHEATLKQTGDGGMLMNGYVADITEQRGLEDALQESKEAADFANRAKSTFLATMSHEIRTPMNLVLGTLELLSLTPLDADQQASLEVARSSSKSLLRIINDILDFSKIEAGKMEIRPEAASIEQALEGVHSIYAGSAIDKGLQLSHVTDPKISPALLVDAVRLRQILNNFVSNALKFTQSGAIEIRAELIGQIGASELLRFTVHDTGIGVSAEAQQSLFQPYSQGDAGAARREGGTGLGLTICRRLADMMGGSVEMESELGKGTTMVLLLTLPVADVIDMHKVDFSSTHEMPMSWTSAHRIAPAIADAEIEGTLLLLVDDHPINRMLLTRQVNTLGYAAESAEHGGVALERWRTGRFGMVITDCNMPEMDGYDLARNIRSLERESGARRTPIVACTANALGSEADRCIAAGMDAYLAKPVELWQIQEMLDRWLPISKIGVAASAAHEPGPRAVFRAGFDTAPRAQSALLDPSVLALMTGGDPLVEKEILTDFRRINATDTEVLKLAVEACDVQMVARTTHRMLGASRIIGAPRFAEACSRIGVASVSNDWSAVATGMLEFDVQALLLNAHIDARLHPVEQE